MSSFTHPHHLYLFRLRDGKSKLAYGTDPKDALSILRDRLTDAEMERIDPEGFVRIRYKDLMRHIDRLG